MVRASLFVLALATLNGLALSPEVRADSFSLSVGGGRGHGYHHHCHPGWGFSYGWYAPPPVVYVPPPVIQERVYVQPPVIQERVYVQPIQPAPATYAPAAAMPQAATYSSNSSTLPPPPNRDTVEHPVVIRNSNGRRAPVAFMVDQREEELNDGQTRTFSGSGARVVEFDRGGDRGTARYQLSGGLYSFVVTSNGWDLVKDTDVPQTAKRPILRKNELPSDVISR